MPAEQPAHARSTKELTEELSERDLLALTVAYLISKEKSQKEIRRELQINSATEVSRLANLAKSKGWLSWHIDWPAGVDQTQIEDRAFPRMEELRKRLDYFSFHHNGRQTTLRNLHVVFTGEAPDAYTQGQRFGREAAGYIVAMLKDASSCAIAWGRTIRSIIEALDGKVCVKDLTVMPISGEPLNNPNILDSISSSEAARGLARALGARNPLSLQGVAARIPATMGDQRDTIRQFFATSEDYARIFVRPANPLIAHVDMILSGIGDVESSTADPWFKETIELEGIGDGELSELAVGNIGGVWLPRKAKHRERIDQINQRWLGIQRRDFEACAARGRDGARGVTVVARDANKATVLSRAMGMINTVIIDQHLAKAILELSPEV